MWAHLPPSWALFPPPRSVGAQDYIHDDDGNVTLLSEHLLCARPCKSPTPL